MRFLKGLVIFMGILIIAGLAVIVITIFNRSQINSNSQVDIKLELPIGAKVLDKSVDKNKLFFLIRLKNGKEIIKVFNLNNGKKIKNIEIIK